MVREGWQEVYCYNIVCIPVNYKFCESFKTFDTKEEALEAGREGILWYLQRSFNSCSENDFKIELSTRYKSLWLEKEYKEGRRK